MRTTPTALLLAVLIASAPALGAPGLASLDTDRDGAVSSEEFAAALRQRFDRIDKDRSGRINRSELRSFAMRQMTSQGTDPLFSRRDKRPDIPFDRNGEVDFAAFSKMLRQDLFDPLDRQRDGRLTADELAAAQR